MSRHNRICSSYSVNFLLKMMWCKFFFARVSRFNWNRVYMNVEKLINIFTEKLWKFYKYYFNKAQMSKKQQQQQQQIGAHVVSVAIVNYLANGLNNFLWAFYKFQWEFSVFICLLALENSDLWRTDIWSWTGNDRFFIIFIDFSVTAYLKCVFHCKNSNFIGHLKFC